MNAHPADNDMARVGTLVRELLDEFPHPDTGKALPGLLGQAWAATTELLEARPAGNDERGGYQKPGSRPPSPNLLTLMADVQSCLDYAHQVAADELGCFVNSGERETALRRIPALLEATLSDCRDCERCSQGATSLCRCRHRTVTRRLGVLHSSLMTDLMFQEPASLRKDIVCPGCGLAGHIVVRKDQERIYCRRETCDWHREGIFAIIAVAS